MSLGAYIPPVQKSKRDLALEAARAGVEKCQAKLDELQKKMLHRSYGRNASLQQVRQDKAEIVRLNKNQWAPSGARRVGSAKVNLKNKPWKMLRQDDQAVVVDSEDFDVATLTLEEDYLPGTLPEELDKARAIARLPEMLEVMGKIHAASQAEDVEAFDAATLELMGIYGQLLAESEAKKAVPNVN